MREKIFLGKIKFFSVILILLTVFCMGTSSAAETTYENVNVKLTKNEAYQAIPEENITIDSKYCLITIQSDVPIYYAYLSLGTKKSVVKQSKLLRAEKIDGKYVIDYSSCKPTKSYCIGIGTRNENYTVDGFSFEYKDKEDIYVYQRNGTVKKSAWNGNKYYICKGSTFDYTYSVHAYYSSEVNNVSKIKFNANRGDNISGGDLIMSASVKSDWVSLIDRNWISEHSTEKHLKIMEIWKVIKSYKSEKYSYRKVTWTYPFHRGWRNSGWEWEWEYKLMKEFPYDYIWREKGNLKWLPSSEFTGKKLKSYLETGATLELRFDTIDDCHSVERSRDNDRDVYSSFDWVENDILPGVRYGVPQTLQLKKASKAKAPKITVSAVSETISIQNGMQYSLDGESWNTVLPYKTAKSLYKWNDFTFDEKQNPSSYYHEYEDSYFFHDYWNEYPYYTWIKVKSLRLDELSDDMRGSNTIYVRKLAPGNGLPSETTVISIPYLRYAAPEITVESTAAGDGVKVTKILHGLDDDGLDKDIVQNPVFEYCLDDYEEGKRLAEEKVIKQYGKKYNNIHIYYMNSSFKWFTCKEGTVIKQGTGIFYIDFSYTDKKGNIKFKTLKNYSVNIPLGERDGCRVYFRRKAVESKDITKKVFCSDTAYFKGMLPDNISYNDFYRVHLK